MDTIGPSWLSCIQWNLSIVGTIGTQLAVLYREVFLTQRYRFVHSSMWLELQTVSSLERCPLFRMSFIERFHCVVLNAYLFWVHGEADAMSMV